MQAACPKTVPDETFNFNSNTLPVLIRTQQNLSAQINEKIKAAIFEMQRVMGNGPTVFDQGLFHCIMANIFCRHTVTSTKFSGEIMFASSDSNKPDFEIPEEQQHSRSPSARQPTCRPDHSFSPGSETSTSTSFFGWPLMSVTRRTTRLLIRLPMAAAPLIR